MNPFYRANKRGINDTRAVAIMLEVRREPYRSIGQIARAVGVAKPSVTRHIDALEKRGLATRKVNDDDKRLVKVWLTQLGIEVLSEIVGGGA